VGRGRNIWQGTNRPSARAGAVAAYALLHVAQAAWAQAANPEAASLEGLRRQEERSREQQHQLEPKADVLKPATGQRVRPAELAPEERCFTVRELRLQGQDWERFTWVADAALPYLGRCLGVQGLARVAGQLDEQLVERGFVTTRVSLPSQNLQSGVLQIQMHVGRIADIRLVDVGPGGPKPGTGWSNAFPVSQGDILNIRDIEQGVEQMKRLPSQSVTTQLEPGPQPDTSILVIQRQSGGWRERLRGGLTLDNSGGAALGRTQLSANLVLDNPLGLNDVASASVSTNAESPSGHHRSQSLGLNYSIPWGYNTLSLSASHNRFAQFVQGTTVRFLSSGNSQTAEARLQRTIWRNSSARLGVYGALSMRRAESYLDDVEVLVQRRRTSTAEAGVNYKQLLQNGSLEFDLGQRRGLSWNAQEDLTTASAGGPTLRPRMWQAAASYTQGFALDGRQLQYSGNLRAQHTADMTLSIDQIAIGGRGSVRGFDGDAVLLAENGWVWRNELATPVSLGDAMRHGAMFFALDMGRVWGPSDINLVGNKLAGAGVGLRGDISNLQFQLTLATPLRRPEGFRTRRWSAYASLSYAF
jgi:hemolysin activation/secretion protein